MVGLFAIVGAQSQVRADVFTWTNVGGGNFDVAANWSPASVPGPNDTIIFNSPMTYTVQGTGTVSSILIAGSNVAFNGAITTTNLNVTTNGGGLILPSGNFVLNGTGTISSASTLTLTSGQISGTGSLTLNGTGTWDNTFINVPFTIGSGGSLTTVGTNDRSIGKTLTNQGTFVFAGGRITNAGFPGVFQNEALLDVQSDVSFLYVGGGLPTLTNMATGTIRKSGGTGTFDISWLMNNAGTVDIQSGRFRMLTTLTNTGTLTATGAAQVVEFQNAGTTLSAGTTLNGTGRFLISNATVTVGSNLNVPNIDFSGGNLNGTGTLTVTNDASWASTFLNAFVTVGTGATLTTVGTNDHPLGGTLTNRGTVAFGGGRITNGGNPGIFQNEALLDVQNDVAFTYVGGGLPTVTNMATGTIRKSGGTGTFDISWLMNNAGTVDIQSGRFRMLTTLTNTGTLTATGAAQVIEFQNGTTTLSAGTTLNGTGRFLISNATVTVGSNLNVPNIDFSGGTLNGTGTLTVTNDASWASTFLNGFVTIGNGATLTTVGTNDHPLGGTLTNRGTVAFAAGRIINGGNPSFFQNEALLDAQSDVSFTYVGGGFPTLTNMATGTIRKSGGTGTFDISWLMNNAGTVDIQSGRFRMLTTLTNTGTLTATGTAQVIEFQNGTTTLSAGTTLNGTGRFLISNATVTVGSNLNVPNIDFSGGNLNGTGTLTVTNDASWASTFLNGFVTIGNGGTLTTVGTNDHPLGGTLINRGTVAFAGGRITNGGNASLFQNEALLNAQDDVSIIYVGGALPSFLNATGGTVRKTGGTGPLTINWDFANNGTIECPRDFRVGNFTQSVGGVLNVDIGGTGAGVSFDRIQGNSFNFNGTLNLSLTNGFTPAIGQTFDIVTFNSRTGDFTTINGTNQGAVTFQPTILANSYRLNVIASPCPALTVGPATLPNATIGVAYSQTFSTTGGVTPYSYTVSSGALPTGLTLTTAGLLSGTPTVNGSFTFEITATDANGCPGTRSYTVTVSCPTITLAPASLPGGAVGAVYGQTITASGGVGTYTFSLSGGTLPPGLVLSGTGVLAGTPTAQGTYQFIVQAADSSTGCSGTAAYTVIIGCPTITLSGLGNGTVGTAYNQTVTASGGASPYSFAVTAGTLPTGLSLATSGAITGTPTVTGTFNFTITATDGSGCTGSQAFSVTINCQTITVNPATLPDGATGTPYSQTVSAVGGQGTVAFTISAGSLPTGLNLAGATGVISGSPTASGTFTFTVTATDTNGCTGSRAYTVNISCPTITLSALPDATVGTGYNQTVTATGGQSPYSFAVTNGALPTGLTLTTAGVLSGTPTAAGSFTFTITATDSRGCTGSRSYTVTANCPSISVSPATLPSATVGVAYSQTLSATGGTSPYAFTVTNGSLPTGVTLSSTGSLSGTPTATGTFNFTITATDANGCAGSRNYSVTVVCPAISISPASLPSGNQGVFFSQSLTATGGTTPYSFQLTSGLLPTGLTFTQAGRLSGTPTQTGTFNLTFTVTDGNGCTGTITYSLVIGCPTIFVSPASLPNATIGVPYSQTLTASGGASPYAFTVTNGSLPANVTLTTAGVLSGTATTAGGATFTVTATDANGCTGTATYTLTIDPAGSCAYTVAPTALDFPSSGGTGRVTVSTGSGCTFTASGAPDWITGLATSGTGSQTLTFTVAVNNDTNPRSATLTIAGQSVTVTQSGAVNLNSQIGLVLTGSSLVAPTCSSQGYGGEMILNATLTNVGSSTIYHGYFQVVELREANGVPPALPFRLLSADGATCTSGGTVGDRQTVDLGTGLAPGQSVTLQFRIALPSVRRYRFLASFFGGSVAPLARVTGRRAASSKSSVSFGEAMNFIEHPIVAVREKDGLALVLDPDFVLP